MSGDWFNPQVTISSYIWVEPSPLDAKNKNPAKAGICCFSGDLALFEDGQTGAWVFHDYITIRQGVT